MSGALIAIGILICLLSVAAVVQPTRLLEVARKLTIGTSLRLFAFVIRVLLGVLLILVAPTTEFALTLRVLGTLSIASGVLVLILGNEGIQRIVDWALRQGPAAVVVGGIIGVVLGAFLIYAA